jgi:hypothetical protein
MLLNPLLALLPSAAALKLAYSPPAALLAKAEANEDCNLPRSYTIQDFIGRSNNTGETLAAYNFTFTDTTTQVTTLCHYNASSTSTTPPGLTPRFACEDSEIKFIWEDDDKDLWMIERVCPGPDGFVFPFPLNLADEITADPLPVPPTTKYRGAFTWRWLASPSPASASPTRRRMKRCSRVSSR